MASGGYCMYCYSRVKVDKKLYGNLEHAIEKSNSDRLIECIPNIGMACPICNMSFKRIGEQKRKITDFAIQNFEDNSKCTAERRKQCTVPCKPLRLLQKKIVKCLAQRLSCNQWELQVSSPGCLWLSGMTF